MDLQDGIEYWKLVGLLGSREFQFVTLALACITEPKQELRVKPHKEWAGEVKFSVKFYGHEVCFGEATGGKKVKCFVMDGGAVWLGEIWFSNDTSVPVQFTINRRGTVPRSTFDPLKEGCVGS